jgi:hypothetical protein
MHEVHAVRAQFVAMQWKEGSRAVAAEASLQSPEIRFATRESTSINYKQPSLWKKIGRGERFYRNSGFQLSKHSWNGALSWALGLGLSEFLEDSSSLHCICWTLPPDFAVEGCSSCEQVHDVASLDPSSSTKKQRWNALL